MNYRMDGHPNNSSLRCFISDPILADGLFQHQTAVQMTRLAQAPTLHHLKHLQVVCASMLEKVGRAVHQSTLANPHQNGVENLQRLTVWSETATTPINSQHKQEHLRPMTMPWTLIAQTGLHIISQSKRLLMLEPNRPRLRMWDLRETPPWAMVEPTWTRVWMWIAAQSQVQVRALAHRTRNK